MTKLEKRKKRRKRDLKLIGVFLLVLGTLTGGGMYIIINYPITEVSAKELNAIVQKPKPLVITVSNKQRQAEEVIIKEEIHSENIEKEPTYSDEDLYWLSHIVFAEAGASYCSDEMQMFVGSVVLNRVNHPSFPNNLYDVIWEEGQYQPTWNGHIEKEPDQRTIDNCIKLLEEGSIIPPEVIFQAEFTQGSGTYREIPYYIGDIERIMYFCY